MKSLVSLVAILLLMSGCSFDASSRPIQPTPAPVIANAPQAYCCGGCDVGDEQAVCTNCRRTSASNCADSSQRLLCVTNRVEVPESQTTFRVTCY
jgi:hypothetical protein